MGELENNCLFCNIYKERTDIIYENEHFWAQIDKFPITPGHSEIIPKKHIVSILDLNEEEIMFLHIGLRDMIKKINSTDLRSIYQKFIDNPVNDVSKYLCEQMLKHEGINVRTNDFNSGNNDGLYAGRTIHHFHYHIIPRYKGDVPDPTGGIRNIIPQYGNYKKLIIPK